MASSFPTTERRVFKRLAVDVHFNVITDRRVLVEWALEPSFAGSAPGPYTFTLYRGYAVNDDNFVAVAKTVDQPWLYDNNPVFPETGVQIFYRVELEDGDGQLYTSQAASGASYWGRYDFSIAKEIIRKETMLQRKRAGVKGWILKQRLWGDMCECTNAATGQTHDPLCDSCYGTGIEGGYYEPVEYWVIMNPTQRLQKLDANRGLIVQTIESVRSLAYPLPTSGDIWVNAYTDQRYIVQPDIAALVRHRGIDLVLNLRFEEHSRSQSIYNIPVPCS